VREPNVILREPQMSHRVSHPPCYTRRVHIHHDPECHNPIRDTACPRSPPPLLARVGSPTLTFPADWLTHSDVSRSTTLTVAVLVCVHPAQHLILVAKSKRTRDPARYSSRSTYEHDLGRDFATTINTFDTLQAGSSKAMVLINPRFRLFQPLTSPFSALHAGSKAGSKECRRGRWGSGLYPSVRAC